MQGTLTEGCGPGTSGFWFMQGCHRVASAGISLRKLPRSEGSTLEVQSKIVVFRHQVALGLEI